MMNVTEALHCIGCGAELGLTPLSHTPCSGWSCPRCQTHHLDAFCSDDGIIHDCPRCGGQFVPQPVVATLVKRYQLAEGTLTQRICPNNPLSDKVTYLPCPDCRELMLRRNFGRVSGIIVDVCAKHGIWFDVGELPRILAFVGNGGLQRTAAVDAEQKRALAEARANPIGAAVSMSNVVSDPLAWQDMREAARSFVQWVQEMLR
jgi:Zn-finger nucleic acid-binding protein